MVVKSGLKGRVTDSVETALEAASGLVVVDVAGRRDLLFSRHLACTDCGISVPELAPRMFSFNSPYGACPDCDGLGIRKAFSEDRIVTEPGKSLRDGALAWSPKGWVGVLERSVFPPEVTKPDGFVLRRPIEWQ